MNNSDEKKLYLCIVAGQRLSVSIFFLDKSLVLKYLVLLIIGADKAHYRNCIVAVERGGIFTDCEGQLIGCCWVVDPN